MNSRDNNESKAHLLANTPISLVSNDAPANAREAAHDAAARTATLSEQVIEVATSLTQQVSNVDSQITISKTIIERRTRQGITPLRLDIKELILVQQFKLVSNIDRYVHYDPGPCRYAESGQYTLGHEMQLYKSSLEMFQPMRVYVRYKLNEGFFKNATLSITYNVPMSNRGLSDIGSVLQCNSYAKVFNGILNVILTIMMDNRILYDVKDSIIPENTTYDIISGTIQNEDGPSIVMASRYNGIKWLKQFINELIEDADNFRFKYGRIDSSRDTETNVQLIRRYAANTDQYYASILNINARYLRSGNNVNDRMRSLISAYALKDVIISILPNTDLNPYNSFDIPTMSRVVLMSAFLLNDFSKIVIEDNICYFEEANIFSFDDTFRMMNRGQENSQNARYLYDYIVNRKDICEFSMINGMMAYEISPVFWIFDMVKIPTPTRIDEAIVIIFELFLFQITFPNCFDRIKGLAQGVLIQCFALVDQQEVNRLLEKCGYKFTIREDGVIIFHKGANNQFDNPSDYLANVYPILFSDLQQHNVPMIKGVMDLFKPIGELVPDTGADAAGFPRFKQKN